MSNRKTMFMLAVIAAVCIEASYASAEMKVFTKTNTCSNTNNCNADCDAGQIAITGHCIVPGSGQNGEGFLQNVGISSDLKSWWCTYTVKVAKAEAFAMCVPASSFDIKSRQ
jgi:hypothetical protein